MFLKYKISQYIYEHTERSLSIYHHTFNICVIPRLVCAHIRLWTNVSKITRVLLSKKCDPGMLRNCNIDVMAKFRKRGLRKGVVPNDLG